MAKSRSSRWFSGVALAALFLPTEVNAQTAPMNEPARSFLELRERLRPGDGVFVVDTDRTKVRGFIDSLSDSTLTLLVGNDRRTFTEADVVAVRRVHDSLWNGTVIGALVGGASLGLAASPYGAEIAGPWALVGAGIGAGAGIAIDAALWRGAMLYKKVSRNARFVPEVGRNRKALHMAVTF